MTEHGVLIVGGGIAGAAVAYFLGRRGREKVLLLEKEEQLGTHSTGRNAGVLRTWTADEPTRLLAEEGAEFLRNPPPGFSETPLYDPVGLLLLTDPLRSFDPETFARLKSERSDLEELAPQDVRTHAPFFANRDQSGLLLRDEGRLDPAGLLAGFEHGARAAGAKIRTGAEVQSLLFEAGCVCGARLAGGEELHAERVIIAAGGWAEGLGREVGSGVRLRPTRRHLLVTEVDARVDPRWPVVWTDADPFYTRPESGGLLMSVCDQVDVEPDDESVDPKILELAAQRAARYLPDFASAGVAHFWSGVRTLTEDGHFVIGPDAEVEGLFWAAGLGGHGITTAAAVGRLAAELSIDPDFGHPAAAAVSPARFAASLS